MVFPSGPSRLCSTSHSRQCPGILPTGWSQCSSSGTSEPAFRRSFSAVAGFTAEALNTNIGAIRHYKQKVKTWKGKIRYQKSNTHVPWFWICREINFGLRGPSGEEPFTQKLMSVKSGSDTVKLQPLLTLLKMMYDGHSSAYSSSLCLGTRRKTHHSSRFPKTCIYICLSRLLIVAM